MSVEITGLVIAKNEAQDLPKALDLWRPAYDTLVVVDDRSSDDTRDIAIGFGAKVVDACMDDTTGFAGLRNLGLDIVETSHVLVFDADELPTPTVIHSIRQAIQDESDLAYRFRRRNNAFGNWLDNGRFNPDWQTRLFPSTVRYPGRVHETPILAPETNTLDLDGIVEHYTYRTLQEYITKMVDYTKRFALDNDAPPLLEALKVGPRNFIKQRGYRDGWRGLLMACGDSWQAYMLRHFRHLLKAEFK